MLRAQFLPASPNVGTRRPPSGILVNFTYYGVVFVLSFYLQQTHGYTPLQAGLATCP